MWVLGGFGGSGFLIWRGKRAQEGSELWLNRTERSSVPKTTDHGATIFSFSARTFVSEKEFAATQALTANGTLGCQSQIVGRSVPPSLIALAGPDVLEVY